MDAARRVEAVADRARVLRVRDVQWRDGADFLLGIRAPRLPRDVGQRRGHRVPVQHARHQLRRLHVAALGQAQGAGHGQLHRHGRVAARRHRVRDRVRRRRTAALRVRPRRRVRHVRVLRPDRRAAHALVTMRRDIPDGRQRYVHRITIYLAHPVATSVRLVRAVPRSF